MTRSLLAVLSLFTLLGSLLFATPASAAKASKPVMLSTNNYEWHAGADGWVNLNWTTEAAIDDVRVVAESNDANVTVAYPTNTPGFTGLYDGPTLEAYEMDQSALLIQTETATKKNFIVNVKISYTAGGRQQTDTHVLHFRVSEWDGAYFELATENVAVGAGDSPETGWIDLDYIGLAPELTDFQVEVVSDLDLLHPQGGFTSLHHNEQLENGERDIARIWVDPEQLEAGDRHDLVLTTRFMVGGEAISETHTVTLYAS